MSIGKLVRKFAALMFALLIGICALISLTSALQVMAQDSAQVHGDCNADAFVTCTLDFPTSSATEITTTVAVTRDNPITLRIRVTTTNPLSEFSEQIRYLVFLNHEITISQEITSDRETSRTAVFTATIPPPTATQTQTLVEFELFTSNSDTISGGFIVSYTKFVSRPTYLAAAAKNYCLAPDDACFEPNNTLSTANPALNTSSQSVFVGSVNSIRDRDDFYKITFTEGVPYTVTLTPVGPVTSGDLDLFLYKPQSSAEVCRSSFVGVSTERIRINALPCSASSAFSMTTVISGDYRLRVIYQDAPMTSSTVFYTISVAR